MPYGTAYGNSDYLAKRQQQQARVEAARRARLAKESGRVRSNFGSRMNDRVRVTFNALMMGVSDDILTAKQARELWVAITEEGQPDDTPMRSSQKRTFAELPKPQRRTYSPPTKPKKYAAYDDDSDWERQEEEAAREEQEWARKVAERKQKQQEKLEREKRRAKEREREERERRREEEDRWAREDDERLRQDRDRQDRDRRAKPARDARPRTPERSTRHTSSLRREPAEDSPEYGTKEDPTERMKKAKMEEEILQAEQAPSRLVPCNVCGRKFNEDRIVKHEMACEKSANSKRKVFNASEKRKTEDMAQVAPSGPVIEKKPTSKVPKWKRDHLQFQKALKSGKSSSGGATAAIEEDIDDRQQCPHCGRKFNPDVAERHIPKCKNTINKPGIRRR